MQFPFETTTKDGRKATVLGVMPDGRLAGYIVRWDGTFTSWHWGADGSDGDSLSITLPFQIKPLTTYRMRGGGLAWTSGLISDGSIRGISAGGFASWWRVCDGRVGLTRETPYDLIEELPPGTTA